MWTENTPHLRRRGTPSASISFPCTTPSLTRVALDTCSQELLAASERARKEQQARQDTIRRLESRVFELKDKMLQSKGSYESIALLRRNVTEIETSSGVLQQEIQVGSVFRSRYRAEKRID
jgi:hypothetical protein